MNNMDHILQSKLQHAESTVPDGMWQRVELGLTEENNNRLVGYFWLLGLGLILAITLGSFAYLKYSTSNSSPIDNTESDNSRIVVTDSYITTIKSVDVKDSTFIKNIKAIKEKK